MRAPRQVDLVCIVWRESIAEILRFGTALSLAWSRLSPEQRGAVILVGSGAKASKLEAAADALERATGAPPQVVALPVNRGAAHAANAGFARCGSPYVAWLDSDGAADRDLLVRLAEALDANDDGALAAGRVIDFSARDAQSGAAGTSEIEWGSGGATLYRREAFTDVGGFDELFRWYCEDMDFGYRVRARGWRCLRVEGAFLHHPQGRSSFRRLVRFTEFVLVWRHIHFSRRVTLKSAFAQVPLSLRDGTGSRSATLAATTLGLIAYLGHIPACERRLRR